MNSYLIQNKSDALVVVILQLCNMGISNVWHCTKMLINDDIEEISYYKKIISHILGYSAMSLGDDLLQTQPLTMLEVRESTKNCLCTVLARINSIDKHKKRYYNPCLHCKRKVEPTGNKFYCVNYNYKKVQDHIPLRY
ncbi:hypothetical protein AAZX31_07G153400 [Glycine max]